MPTYGIAILVFYGPHITYNMDPRLLWTLLGVTFVTTFLAPLSANYLLLKNHSISSLNLESRLERTLPFLITSICFFIGYYFVKQLPIQRIFHLFMLGILTANIAALIINYRSKISIHMIGIGGIVGAMFGISQILMTNQLLPVVLGILIAGILGTARLVSGSHNPPQIYTGFLTGFFSVFLILDFLA